MSTVKDLKKQSDDRYNLILKYKLLAGLYRVKEMSVDVSICLSKDQNLKMKELLGKLKESYPNINFEDLKEVYEIPNGDCTYEQIRYWSYGYLTQEIYSYLENYADLDKFFKMYEKSSNELNMEYIKGIVK